jgi:hypothetical protein
MVGISLNIHVLFCLMVEVSGSGWSLCFGGYPVLVYVRVCEDWNCKWIMFIWCFRSLEFGVLMVLTCF